MIAIEGWIIPPPHEPAKKREEFKKEREQKVRWLISHGFLKSERIRKAMLKIPSNNPHLKTKSSSQFILQEV